ncbi:MAG: DsrE family protein [Promethearchaeota archaeon]
MLNEKIVLFAFNGDPMCFVHVLLNALDMHDNQIDVKIVIEGSATKLIKNFHDNPKVQFINLYQKVKEQKLIEAVCKACATKMGSIKEVELEKLPIVGNMNGHPSMRLYLEQGYKIITF